MADGGILNKTVHITQDLATADDRRRSQRFRTSVPLTVFAGDSEIPAYARDLSNRGVYFYLALADSELIDGNFEFLVEFPAEITLSTNCRIRCRGRLVRKEMASRNLAEIGVAAEILDYSILGEAISSA
jgi:hypothetical protein